MSKYYASMRTKSKKLASRIAESMVFLGRFIGSPRQIGSVTPSSPYLTRAIMNKIDWGTARYIAELGAGTGVFTRNILRRLREDGELLAFEIDPKLREIIEAENEGLTVYGDARIMPKIMKERCVPAFDYVVSSLPYAVLPPQTTSDILDGILQCLKPGGKFIAYQYSTHMKSRFGEHFTNVEISFVLRNIPPAFVYECVKSE
ncbi:SAM-dependent methyltransferase [Synergistales bacterium]|nr:SAM-dependent methyltransferase [Synergistales bacterium]